MVGEGPTSIPVEAAVEASCLADSNHDCDQGSWISRAGQLPTEITTLRQKRGKGRALTAIADLIISIALSTFDLGPFTSIRRMFIASGALSI